MKYYKIYYNKNRESIDYMIAKEIKKGVVKIIHVVGIHGEHWKYDLYTIDEFRFSGFQVEKIAYNEYILELLK